jgi:hypothetical protein
MKIKAILVATVFAAGIAASFAFAKPPHPTPGHPSTSTSTSTGTVTSAVQTPARPCNHVSLNGDATTGSITLTVKHADSRHHTLVNTSVTLTVPAGARVKATACDSAGTLTLRNLKVDVKPAKP